MNFKSTLIKGLLLFVLFASACKKDKHEIDPTTLFAGKLKEELVHVTSDIKFVYFYNEDKTLKTQELRGEGLLLAVNDYRYLDGKLYFRTHSVYTGPNTPLKEETVSKYTYTGELLTEVLDNALERDGEESNITTRFSYDTNGFLRFARQANVDVDGNSVVVYRTFNTDDNGNILKIRELTIVNDKVSKSQTYTMQYDDKTNPRYNLIDPMEFSQFFSPNNVVNLIVKNDDEETSTEFRYLYTPQQTPATMESNYVVPTEFKDFVKWAYY